MSEEKNMEKWEAEKEAEFKEWLKHNDAAVLAAIVKVLIDNKVGIAGDKIDEYIGGGYGVMKPIAEKILAAVRKAEGRGE